MKVFVLTEIDCTNSPTKVIVSTTLKEANETMQKMYAAALEKYGVPESDANNSFVSGSHAVIGHVGYYLDIFDGEWAVNDELEVLQEMTVAVENRWRESLMDGAIRSMSRDQVWALVRKWAEEYNERYAGFDYYANNTTIYDAIDAFVDSKIEELNGPYPEIVRMPDCVETDDMIITDEYYFGDSDEHWVKMTAKDGVATSDCICMVYPKLADLTKEQIDAIESYTGRIFDSKRITPWDVAVKFGKIVSFGIMSTSNGHPEYLVRQINRRWVEDKYMFKPILCALYERDIDEITDADSFLFETCKMWPEYKQGIDTNDWGPYNTRFLESMKEEWMIHAENYLQHIADGQDLVAILKFVRYDRSENA